MATFSEDLHRALGYTARISQERARGWKTRRTPLLRWQSDVFASLGDIGAVQEGWLALSNDPSTEEQARLLHQELQAIIEFQSPLVDLPYSHEEELEEELPNAPPSSRKIRPLKKAIQLMKTLLESIKEIFGDLLGAKGKAAIQLAIEAAEAFS